MDIIRFLWMYPHFTDVIRIGNIDSYLAFKVRHALHSFVLVVDIICIDNILHSFFLVVDIICNGCS